MGWGGSGKGKRGWGSGGCGAGGGASWQDRLKAKRRNEQEQAVAAKTERESGYFWEKQAHLARSGPPKPKGQWKLKEEEKEIFGKHDGTVGIDFNKYDNIPVQVSGKGSEEVSPVELFEELWDRFELPDFLWANIERCKYTKPTPIQRFAMPAALAGHDCMCCAQTGSGKTCAFLVPILSCIDESQATGKLGVTVGEPAAPKAIVLAPTRELCSQIHLEARKLSFASAIRCSEVYGGVEAKPQLWDLAAGSDIVTATPGRLKDFIDRGVMTMSQVGYLVLDEADRMLDMGFEPQIREIVQQRDMPQASDGRTTLMFSATFPRPIQTLAQQFMRSYIWVGVGNVGGAADTVTQKFILTPSNHNKETKIFDVLKQNPNDATLIFVAMKRTAAALTVTLNQAGVRAVAIHGDMEQREREASLSQFRNGKCKIIVATDVAARGLDIPSVSHVINYDLPEQLDSYVHRIGRTGRVGRKGWATSFFTTKGNYANHKILGGLMGILHDAGQPVPDFMKREADAHGIRPASTGKKSSGGFGGGDARGGKAWTRSVSTSTVKVPRGSTHRVARVGQQATGKGSAGANKSGKGSAAASKGSAGKSGNKAEHSGFAVAVAVGQKRPASTALQGPVAKQPTPKAVPTAKAMVLAPKPKITPAKASSVAGRKAAGKGA